MMSSTAKAARLRGLLTRLDDVLAGLGEEPTSPPPAPGVVRELSGADVNVVVGNSAMAEETPQLVEQITSMINRAYTEAHKEELREGQVIERVDDDEVIHRLGMGDAGPRANRVLHLAYRGDQLVGCCSSTMQLPWAEEGVGQWGLLSVAPEAMRTGVASALVRAAESRLAAGCSEIQIEYEYTPGTTLSQRLMDWYEGKCGFRCKTGRHRGGGAQFRVCRKQVRSGAAAAAKRRRLEELRASMVTELEEIEANVQAEAAAQVDASASNKRMLAARSDGEDDADSVDNDDERNEAEGAVECSSHDVAVADETEPCETAASAPASSSASRAGGTRAASLPPAGAGGPHLHARVVLVGIQKRPSLNGREGEVVGFAEASGRYAVRLVGEPSEEKILALKCDNLRLQGEAIDS